MCSICAKLQTFDTQCNLTSAVSYAERPENGDAVANTNTSSVMFVGDSYHGDIAYAGDIDWVRVSLVAGNSYSITLQGMDGGGGSLPDPFLTLYNDNGWGGELAFDDDTPGSLDSELVYTATTSGTYYVSAEGYANNVGSYTLRVTQTAAPSALPTASLDTMAAYLTDGYWNDTNQPNGSFNTSSSNVITVNLSGLTAAGQQLAQWALYAWESVANIDFVVSGGSSAQIQFIDHDSGAYVSSSFLGGALQSSTVNISTSWLSNYGTTVDSYSLSTYIHEVGHAIGLGHLGPYDGNGSFAGDAVYANDSRQLSIMSYFDPTENPNTNASNADLMSAMMVDIVAIQNLYGAANGSSVTAGNTIWGEGSNMGSLWGHVGNALTGTSISGIYNGGDMALTIYDRGGIDTLNFSSSTTNDIINMNGQTFSNVGGLIGNVGIARGTVIENLDSGSGNDLITGSSVGNIINSFGGNDTINSGNGYDTINGGDGADRLWAGNGNDLAFGGSGNDRIGGMDGFDTIWAGQGDDIIWGGGWSDTLGGGSGNDLIFGENGNDLVWGGDGNDTIDGGLHDDTLRGGSQHDSLNGGDGNDNINGGWGQDTLKGGNGNDLLDGFIGDDIIFGGAGNDVIVGGAGRDTIYGGSGNDTIYTGWGNDTVAGGDGADLFVFSTASGQDVYTDFDVSEGDVLRINDSLWTGSLTAAQMVAEFGSVSNGTLTLNFDGGEQLVLNGVTDLTDAVLIF